MFEERVLVEEVCRLGFDSIVRGEPHEFVVTRGLAEAARKDPLLISVEKYLLVKSMEKGVCKIVLKSKGKLLAFRVKMEEADGNPFYYVVSEVEEVVPEKDELI